MKKGIALATVAVLALIFGGCSQKAIKKDIKETKESVKKFNKKIERSFPVSNSSEDIIKGDEEDKEDIDLAVEVEPDVDKVKVITKVKPEIELVEEKKVKSKEPPVVVVDPVEEEVPIEKLEVDPVVDDKLRVITEVEPVIGAVEEIPVEDEPPAIVVDPVAVEE